MAMQRATAYLADTSGPFKQLLLTEKTSQAVKALIHEKKDAMRAVIQQSIEQDIPYHVVYGDMKWLDLDIAGLKRLLESNEESRLRWRRFHILAWRNASKRPLKVVDLPKELLTLIFSNFQDIHAEQVSPKAFPSDEQLKLPSPDVDSIKSVRLTCRACCDVASQFLMPLLDISLTQSSLQHLEQVSKHPTISKGVRTLKMNTNTYSPVLANDRGRFYETTVYRLRELRRMFDHEATETEREVVKDCRLIGICAKPKHCKMRGLDMAQEETQDVMMALEKLRNQDIHTTMSLDPFETKISKAIAAAHEEYGRRYLEQKSLTQDGQAYAYISAAVRQMPSVHELIIDHQSTCHWQNAFKSGWDKRLDAQKYKTILRGRNPFWQLMVHAGPWKDRGSLQPCLKLKLPSIFHAGSENLTRLDIGIISFSKFHLESKAELQRLRRACQQLKVVQVTFILPVYGPSNAPTLATTYSLLEAILSSPRLEEVGVYITSARRLQDLDLAARLGLILASLPWHKLRKAYLAYFPIGVAALRDFMEKVPEKMNVILSNIYLLEGSWAQALEIMRGKVDSSSRIVNPRGGEMEYLSQRECRYLREEFHDELREGRYSMQRCPGPASFYIRGGNIPNPLMWGPDA
ncbi:hypothetical protein N8I77_010860 [Diaporthe amygdali]|uniref:Uncharacterized protein n=1 Tax=Phomopsis amygdali TaxID=1214568 RepID=A0AAD9VZK6_PHOAM|nr:hypothetical protein N8I77_010860 [Diaporthe amygdali]